VYNFLFSHKLWFFMEHFLSWVFLCLNFGHAHFFPLHYDLHSFKALHNKWCSFIMCAICEKKWLKDVMNQINKDVIIFQCFSYVFFFFFFGLEKYFDLCFDNLIKIYASHHYDNKPFISLQTCFKWHGYSSFKSEKKYTNT
jgi:hypothetical protein